MSDAVFNGPPPPSGRGKKSSPTNALRVACDDRPGEWAQQTVGKKSASYKAQYLRNLGYEAVARGDLVYARKPEHGELVYARKPVSGD